MTRRIIDVSHWQEPVNFKAVATDGIVAIVAKATQGVTGVDPAYAKFKRTAGKYRFLWGSYHFATRAEAAAQVDHYLATAKANDHELLCLDFEENPGGSSMTLNQARDFVGLVEERTGRYPVLYGGAYLKQQLRGQADDLLIRCPLWIAQYASQPVLPPGWSKYALWQYTDGHHGPEPHEVSGIGPCDRNQFNGSITQLRNNWPFPPIARMSLGPEPQIL